MEEDSEWQQGPKFLNLPVNQWPIKSAKDVTATAQESIGKMQKKSFSAVLTRSQVEKELSDKGHRRPPAGLVIQNLVDGKQFSNRTHLIKTVAWIWRAAKKFAAQNKILETLKWEAVPSRGVITVTEHQDALRDLFLAAKWCDLSNHYYRSIGRL